MLTRFISPASTLTLLLSLAAVSLIARAASCGPSLEELVDRCEVSNIGLYVFPHPLLFENPSWFMDGWISIVSVIMIDVAIISAMWLLETTRRQSLPLSIATALILVTASALSSYIVIYRFLSP